MAFLSPDFLQHTGTNYIRKKTKKNRQRRKLSAKMLSMTMLLKRINHIFVAGIGIGRACAGDSSRHWQRWGRAGHLWRLFQYDATSLRDIKCRERKERKGFRAGSFLTGKNNISGANFASMSGMLFCCWIQFNVPYPRGEGKMFELRYICVPRMQWDTFECRVPVDCVGCGCATVW